MFRSNSCLANNLNCYDPSILTSAHIKRSISTLNKILSQNEKKAQSKCGNSSFGCVNDFTLTHRARNPKHKAFLTNQTRLRMIKSVNNLFNEKLPQLEKYTLEEKQYNKDDYIYDKIFLKVFKRRTDKEIIDNKLNLFYAENEEQYENNLKKLNQELFLKGKQIKHSNKKITYIDDKINDIKEKVTFMRGVEYYSFPSIILKKISEANKLYRHNRNLKRKEYLPPFEIVDKIQNERNIFRTSLLQPAFKIMPIKEE